MDIKSLTYEPTPAMLELASLQHQLTELQAREKALREQVLADLTEQGLENTTAAGVRMTKAHRTSYQYSEGLEELQGDLKARQKEERESGKAKPVTTAYLVVRKV